MRSKAVVWLTGLPGSGKSTIARLLRKRIGSSVLFDGQEFGGLEYISESHLPKVRASAQAALRHGHTVICAFISPTRESRSFLRSKIKHFVEVFMDTPIETCKQRDVKSFWIPGREFYYEPPSSPEICIRNLSETASANRVVLFLQEKGYL